jgi:signal transduction histidine kinase
MRPLVSGVELAAWLKSSPVLRHIPIILVTARADNEAVASGLDVGADEYLVKPFSPKELIARVRSMVRLYQSYQELAAEKAEIARRSGMAQVSMGVLHSVGNTLSSAAVTLDLMQERLSKPKTSRLRRALDEIFQGAEGRGGAPPSERDGSLRQYVFMVLEAMEREGEEARADAQRLRERLDAIRDAIRAQEEYAYRNAYRTERLPLHDIVEESLSACGTDLVTAHIAVRLDLRPVDDVVANRHDLLTILHNLLDNARAAVAERGEEDGWIEISTWQERDKICCAVEDSGPGVPQDLRLKVFGYGFTTKPGASGIGLHFAGLRMKSVGGSISFADGRGPGARVVLTFPAGAREEMLAI